MRKFLIVIGVVLGVGVGLSTTIGDAIAVKIVSILMWVIVGVAAGGAIGSLFGPYRKIRRYRKSQDALAGLGMTSDDIMQNYWRDQARPQLSSPLEAEKGYHQFDTTSL
jgi:4-amino-4-deoxy-L-arabinose transferase-like glycosyltransferase